MLGLLDALLSAISYQEKNCSADCFPESSLLIAEGKKRNNIYKVNQSITNIGDKSYSAAGYDCQKKIFDTLQWLNVLFEKRQPMLLEVYPLSPMS